MKKVAGKINKEWHLANHMPANVSLKQRIDWHIGHARNCGCRPMQDKIKQEIEKLYPNF
jgi:hypothetical protein